LVTLLTRQASDRQSSSKRKDRRKPSAAHWDQRTCRRSKDTGVAVSASPSQDLGQPLSKLVHVVGV
jgi:hypothetical protein